MARKLKGKALEAFKKDVKIRPFEEKDAAQCNALFNLVFKQDRTLEQWRWLYQDRPRGGSAIFVADLDGEIIGQYPVIFTLYKCDDVEVMAGNHIDASMKSEYRRTGMYSKMGNMGHDYHDPDLGVGYPLPLYYRFGSKTLGYVAVTKIPRWLKVLTSKRIVERLLPLGPLRKTAGALSGPPTRLLFRPKEDFSLDGFAFEKVGAFDQRADALWERVKHDRMILAVRDSEFLNYRFQKSPFRKFDLFYLLRDGDVIGYVVCMVQAGKKGRKGFLADMLVIRDPEAERAALGYALEYFRGVGVDFVLCLMLDRSYAEHLRNQGFIRVTSPAMLAFKNFKPGKLSTEKLTDPNNWYITALDSDWI